MTAPIVDVSNLCRTFGTTQALQDINLAIYPGQVYGLVGENGAGKTTLLRHFLGLLKPTSGTIRVFGRDPVRDPAATLAKTGFLSEDRDLPLWMRIDQVLSYYQGFFPAWDTQYADELLATFELEPTQRLKTLSRGQLARVGLLVAVAHRPPLLLLDEPSSGLDPVVRQDILAAIIRTVADDGRTVIFSSHLLDEIQRVSDQVAMIHRGRMLLSDSLDSILEEHSRVTIRLAEPVMTLPAIPGAIHGEGSGREWSVISNGATAGLLSWVRASHAEIIDENPPSLEEIFVARVRQSGASGLEDNQ